MTVRIDRQPGKLNTTVTRLTQFVRVVRLRPDPRVDVTLQALLDNPAQWRLLERMTRYDRAHHLHVYQWLVERGHRDPDLLRAALLHDVGKADGRQRVMLGHRIARVLGRAVTPSGLDRLAKPNGSRLCHGLYLAQHHARLGAEMARSTGASDRCCALIARHEDASAGDDVELAALMAADAEATP